MRAVPESQQRTPPLEQALAQLRPAAPALNRDAVMFAAGRASARGSSRPWQWVSVLLACTLVASLVTHRQTPPSRAADAPRKSRVPPRRVAAVDPEPSRWLGHPWVTPRGNAYIHLRNAVLARGLDALPEPAAPAVDGPSRTTRLEWLDAMLPRSNTKA